MSNPEEAPKKKAVPTKISTIIEIFDSDEESPGEAAAGPSTSIAADPRVKNSPGAQATSSRSPRKKHDFTTPTKSNPVSGSSYEIVDLTLDDDSPETYRGYASQAILNSRKVSDSDDEVEMIIRNSAPRRRARASVINRTAEEIIQRDLRIGDLKPHISPTAQKPDISALTPLLAPPSPSPSKIPLPPSPLPSRAAADDEEDPDATITSIYFNNLDEADTPAGATQEERSPSVEYEPYDPQPNHHEEGASFVSEATVVSNGGAAPLLPSLLPAAPTRAAAPPTGEELLNFDFSTHFGKLEQARIAQDAMELDEQATAVPAHAPPLISTTATSSSDESDTEGNAMDVNEPELSFTDAEGRSHSPLNTLYTPPPGGHETVAENGRKKSRKRLREDAYRPHRLGYKHRGAIEWTGPEREDELSRRVLDLFLNMKYPDPYRDNRAWFEWFINNQIILEEPFAPPIHIHDRSVKKPASRKKKKEETEKRPPPPSCPPIEYFYTSRIAYRTGVPDPVKFIACDCTDGCGPGCKCYQRQQELIRNLHTDAKVAAPSPFAYDEQGSLILPHPYPVWECNSHCGCPQDCRNRNVGNGRRVKLDIVKTEHKGWGIEAGQNIPKGTFLCLYGGEMITASAAKEREIQNDLEDPPRSYLFDVDSQWLRHHDGGATLDKDGFVAIGTTWGKNRRPPSPKKLRNQLMTAEQEQAEEDGVKALYVIDARHYGNLARYFNHACDPNAVLRSVFVDDQDVWKPLLCIFARRNIPQGEEITISYKGLREEDTNTERCAVTEPSPPPTKKGKSRKRKKGSRTEKQVGKARSGDMQGAVDTVCQCDSECCDGSIFTWRDEEDE